MASRSNKLPASSIWGMVAIIGLCIVSAFIIFAESLGTAIGNQETASQTKTNASSSSSSLLDHHRPAIEMDETTCSDLESLTSGRWNNATQTFERYSSCSFEPFPTGEEFVKLIENKSIGFYGDSTLKNIAIQIIQRTNITMEEPMGTWGPSEKGYLCGGIDVGQHGSLKMYWTPSVYYQPHPIIPSFRTNDISIISIGVWDLGVLYRGVDAWYQPMMNMLGKAVAARQGKPLYIMNIHGIYASGCRLKRNDTAAMVRLNICQQCNSKQSLLEFRSALQTAVACTNAAAAAPVVQIIDTFGVTSYEDPFVEPRSDGLHYDPVVTSMEADIVLAAILRGIHQHQSNDHSNCSDSKKHFGPIHENCAAAVRAQKS
eukprot:scaffold6148_cov127-Cylindrotheca_fusiformis.AAC.5